MSAEEVADELADMRIEPGLWELTSEVVDVRAPDLPPRCGEPDGRAAQPAAPLHHARQAARPSANFLAAARRQWLHLSRFIVQDGRLRGTMTCPDATAAMDGRYGPQAYDMRMEMASPMPDGATMTLEVRARGRRIGDCEEGGSDMIGYVTLGTNDLDKARAYYDALLGEIGATPEDGVPGDRLHALRHRRRRARHRGHPAL